MDELQTTPSIPALTAKGPYNFTRSRFNQRDILTRRKFGFIDTGVKVFAVESDGDIQRAINDANVAGGGIVQLATATYNLTADLNLYSQISLVGQGSGNSIIDFGNGAFQVKVVGNTPYSTGTVSVTNKGTSVTGSGTTFTAAMAGQSILIGDYWYVIASRASNTSITLDSAYIGSTASGVTFVIANTIDAVSFKGITIQNSAIALMKVQYGNTINFDDFIFSGGLVGIDGDDSATLFLINSFTFGCGTGLTFDNFQFGCWINSGALSSTGDGFVFTKCRNWAMVGFNSENNGARGLVFTTCSNFGVENYALQNNTTIGVELVTNNFQFAFSGGVIVNSGTDGIKLTANSDNCIFYGHQVVGSGGYGLNIAASTDDNNIIIGNYFATNSSGNVTDSGTTTKIRSNIGVADN